MTLAANPTAMPITNPMVVNAPMLCAPIPTTTPTAVPKTIPIPTLALLFIDLFFNNILNIRCVQFEYGHLAEREGFEPSIPCGIPAFQASALGLYATSPFMLYFGCTLSGCIAKVKAYMVQCNS